MEELILYSNNKAAYLFDKSLSVVKQLAYNTAAELAELEQGKFTQNEKKLIELGKGKKIRCINYKEEELKDINCSFDKILFLRITRKIISDKNEIKKIRELAIKRVKQSIKQNTPKDVLINQAVSNIAELEKITNILVKRLREWYSYYFPEFSRTIRNQEKFASMVYERDKQSILKELALSKEESMGVDLPEKDVEEIKLLAERIIGLYELKAQHEKYLEEIMKELCPNMLAVAGASIGGKLIQRFGSLEKVAFTSASTIQVIGAEKALFRHIKTGAKPPKYGIIHEHKYVLTAPMKKRGHVARVLADKISLASKIDYFKGEFIGDKIKKDLDKRFG